MQLLSYFVDCERGLKQRPPLSTNHSSAESSDPPLNTSKSMSPDHTRAADPFPLWIELYRSSRFKSLYKRELMSLLFSRTSRAPICCDRSIETEAVEQRRKLQAPAAMGALSATRFLLPLFIVFFFFFFFVVVVFVSYYNCHACFRHLLQGIDGLDQFISRKSMFLFCNVIIFFITRDSGLLGFLLAPPPPRASADVVAESISRAQKIPDRRSSKSDAAAPAVAVVDLVAVRGAEEEEEEEEKEEESIDPSTEEEEDTDDLHKKIEEFIENFKSQRRMEARQLVVI